MRFWTVGFLVVGLFCLVGCGPTKPPALPTGGKVTVRGGERTIPEGAFLVFHPTSEDLAKAMGTKPFATVGKDGSYELTSYIEKDGAPEGEYGVTIEWRPAPATKSILGEGPGMLGQPDAFGGEYGNPGNPKLKAKVEKGGTNRFDFVLTLPE